MKKRGQITVFVILAIIIVVGVVLFFAFRGEKSGTESVEIPVFVSPINVFVDSCLASVSENVVYSVGEGGGYFFPPARSNDEGISYLYYEGVNYFPEISIMESQIEEGIASNMILCVNNFDDFSNYEIVYTTPEIDVEILDENIFVNMDYSISVSQGNSTYVLRNFNAEVPVRLGLINRLLKKFLNERYYDNGEICIDCVLEDMYFNNLTMEIYTDSEVDVFFIVDETSEKEFRFNFANRKN